MKKHLLLLIVPFTLMTAVQAKSPAPPTIQQREAELIRRFDADGDGVLSPEERANAARVLRAERAQAQAARTAAVNAQTEEYRNRRDVSLIQRFDLDGDGVLSPRERRLAEETLRREREAYAAERKAP